MTFDGLPAYDRLRLHKETCEIGLRAAIGTERERHYRACLAEVESKIAVLVQTVYLQRRADDTSALVRAYRAKQVTPREYSMRMRSLLR